MVYRINALFAGLFGQNQQEKVATMNENDTTTSTVETGAASFSFTVEDSFGDEVSIKNPIVNTMHSKRRNSKRFVIGDESDDVETVTSETETLLAVPNPEWLQQSARLKPGTTLT